MTDDGRHLFDERAQSRRRLTIAAAIAAGLGLLVSWAGIGSGLDLKIYDALFSVRGARDPSSQVVLVAMDDASIGKYGRYPWNRDVYIPAIQNLKAAGAKVIGFDVVFDPTRDDMERERSKRLGEAMTAAGNVVIGFLFDNFADPSPPSGSPLPEIARNAVPAFSEDKLRPLPAPTLVDVEPALAQAAAALGHVNTSNDEDGNIRWSSVLVKHGPRSFPSLALQMARVYQGTPIEEVAVLDRQIRLGYADIPLSDIGRLLVDWPATPPQFPSLSFVNVVEGNFRPEQVSGRAVIIGMTAKGLDEKNFPFEKAAPGALLHASILDNIFKVQFLEWPNWSWLLQLGLTFGLAGLSVVLFPRLRTGALLIVGPALLIALVMLTLFLFIVKGAWFKVVSPATSVLLPFAAVAALRMRETERESRDVGAEKLETERLLGLSFQEKGMLDMALATFNKLPMTPDMKLIYLNLGMDFENRGLKEKAFLAYKRIMDADPHFEDVPARVESLRRAGVGTRIFQDSTVGGAGGTSGLPAQTAGIGGQTAAGFAAQTAGAGTPTAAVGGSTAGIGTPTRRVASSEDADATHGLDAPTAGIGAGATRGQGATIQPGTSGPTGTVRAPARAPDGGVDATMDLPAASSTASRQSGRYEILEKLGRGAMGDVYKVRDPKIGRVAAMKTIRVDMELSPQQVIELRQRFYREAQTAGKLTHPNIVTIYDVGEEQGVSYIVMEFVEGQTLTGLMKKGKALTVPQVKHLIVQSAMGLDYAHQNGVIHRDVKPDNIMISKTGNVKVMDFGIARIVESDMTRTGSVLGTPAYMSPEQFSGSKVDARSDVFSLGVVLYELLTRQRPFRGSTPTAVMFEIIQKQPAPPSQAEPTVSPLWDAVVMKALAKDAKERYQSAADFANAVRGVQAK